MSSIIYSGAKLSFFLTKAHIRVYVIVLWCPFLVLIQTQYIDQNKKFDTAGARKTKQVRCSDGQMCSVFEWSAILVLVFVCFLLAWVVFMKIFFSHI